jgi:hypothetical protein
MWISRGAGPVVEGRVVAAEWLVFGVDGFSVSDAGTVEATGCQ